MAKDIYLHIQRIYDVDEARNRLKKGLDNLEANKKKRDIESGGNLVQLIM